MSYGLQVRELSGTLIDTTVDRLQRIIGTYVFTIPSGQFINIPIPSFVDDGTWTVVVASNGVPPAYSRNPGFVRLYNPVVISISGSIIVLRG